MAPARADARRGRAAGSHPPAPVIPEVDHLLGHRLGSRSRLTFYAGIVDGYYLVADLPRDAYARVADLNRQFADLELGLVDAAIAALAGTLGLSRVATTIGVISNRSLPRCRSKSCVRRGARGLSY